MSTRLTCPACHRVLLLPTDCTAELLSCPRCLARIPNPQVADASAAVQAAPPASAPSPVVPPAQRPRDPGVDVNVRRDQQGTSALMIVLAVFGSLGIGYLMLGFGAVAMQGEFTPLLITLFVLAAMTAVSALWVFGGSPSRTLGANIGRTVLGVLAISGTVVLLGVAVLVFLFVVCLANGGKC